MNWKWLWGCLWLACSSSVVILHVYSLQANRHDVRNRNNVISTREFTGTLSPGPREIMFVLSGELFSGFCLGFFPSIFSLPLPSFSSFLFPSCLSSRLIFCFQIHIAYQAKRIKQNKKRWDTTPWLKKVFLQCIVILEMMQGVIHMITTLFSLDPLPAFQITKHICFSSCGSSMNKINIGEKENGARRSEPKWISINFSHFTY